MKTSGVILAMGIFGFLFGGCSKKPPELPEITSESEAGFADLVFHLDKIDGQSLRVAGLHHGTKVALEVVLASAWKTARLEPKIPIVTHSGAVTLRSVGPESDALLQIMDQLYGTKLAPKAMNATTTFAGMSLEGNPTDLAAGPVKIKLFFESDDETKYAELFATIDVKKQTFHLNEKDPDYRGGIVKALRKP